MPGPPMNSLQKPVPPMHSAAEESNSGSANIPGPQERQTPGRRRSARRSESISSSHAEEDVSLGRLMEYYELFEAGSDGIQKINTVPNVQKMRRSGRNFILRRKAGQQTSSSTGGSCPDNSADRYDYEAKYPRDESTKEMDPTGRVWQVYLDEASQFDNNMVESIRDTVDVILVFAGLFSAIVTTLVSVTFSALQLAHPQITNLLLMEIIALQRAMATGIPVDQVAASPLNADSPSTSSTTTSDLWVNGLWFTSLAFSVFTALIAVLVKQWIQAYSSPTSHGTPRAQAEVRHFRYLGLEQWHVPIIVDLLPTLLHLSIFLFFAGLVVFLFALNNTIAGCVTAIVASAAMMYVVTNFLPLWNPQCPYKTHLSNLAFSGAQSARSLVWRLLDDPIAGRIIIIPLFLLILAMAIPIQLYLYLHPKRKTPDFWEDSVLPAAELLQAVVGSTIESTFQSMKDIEFKAIQKQGQQLHAHMLWWLNQTSANPSVQTVLSPTLSNPDYIVQLTPPRLSGPAWCALLRSFTETEVEDGTWDWQSPGLLTILEQVCIPTTPKSHPLRDTFYKMLLSRYLCHHTRSSTFTSDIFHSTQAEQLRVTLDRYATGDLFDAGGEDTARMLPIIECCISQSYTHALYDLAPDSSSQSLITSLQRLAPLHQAMGEISPRYVRRPEPRVVPILQSWLPRPEDILRVNMQPQIVSLLLVTGFVLDSCDEGICDAFRERDCLRSFTMILQGMVDVDKERYPDALAVDDGHARPLGSIQPNEIDGQNDDGGLDLQRVAILFNDIVYKYLGVILSHSNPQSQEAHFTYLLSHLPALCAWQASQTTVPKYLRVLVQREPMHLAWKAIHESIPALLPTDEQSQRSCLKFLNNLDAVVRQAQRDRDAGGVPPTIEELRDILEWDIVDWDEDGSEHPLGSRTGVRMLLKGVWDRVWRRAPGQQAALPVPGSV